VVTSQGLHHDKFFIILLTFLRELITVGQTTHCSKVAESYHIILIIRHCFVEYSMISSIVINIIKMILKRHNHFHSQYNYFFFFCREPHYLCGEYAIVKYIFSITEKSLKSSEGQYNQHCKSIPRLQNLKSKFCLKVSWNKRKLIRLKLSI